MRYAIFAALLFNLIFYACSMGSKPALRDYQNIRDKSKTFYWPKSKTEKYFHTQTCIKRKRNGKCEEWKVRKLDVCGKQSDWDFAHDSNMILIPKDMVF